MSFKLFIYYCAICGGWAALAAWAIVLGLGIHAVKNLMLQSALIAAVLGMLLAMAVGALDALLNAVGMQRLLRVLVCMGVGLVGGFAGGFFGETLHEASLPKFVGWMIVGLTIGASIGMFDLIRALSASESPRKAIRKTINGAFGGVLGGLLGGLPFTVITQASIINLDFSPLAVGLVILGMLIGLLIGLAQVFLKEAWLKVESGFRAGREVILSKGETTIGRGEGCDIGLFGDHGVEKLHARILQQGNRYLVADANTPGGTFLNDVRVNQATPLRAGDAIRVGRSIIRFGERQKRGQETRPSGAGSRTVPSSHQSTQVAVNNPFADF